MKIAIHHDGGVRDAELPYGGAEHVTIKGEPICPCRSTQVCGKGHQERGHNSVTSAAFCATCGKMMGRIVVTLNTFFGLDEDERVLNGRCRVY